MTRESLPTPRALEAQVLYEAVCLPLIPSVDLQVLTRASDDALRLATDSLDRHGWIERVTIQSADYGDPIVGHVLRASAIEAFARVVDLDERELRRIWPVERRDVLDRIASFEITDAVNRFLTGVVDDYFEEGFGLLDHRTLPRRRASDREWPPLMDAYGCVTTRHDVRPFFVAWDRAAAPAKHRAARVSAWYRARGFDDWPTILIICPGDLQRREWERAIRISAYRRGVDPLEVAFTTTAEAFGKHPTGDCWRVPGEDYLVPLIGVIRPVGTPLRPMPRPSRLDLIDRGVGVQAQTLPQWAEGMLASRRRSARERLAALRLTLGPTHRTALSTLSHHPYLTTRDLPVVLRDEDERVSRLLASLEHHDLAGSLTGGSAPPVSRQPQPPKRYFLTYAGLELLAAAEGVPPLRYAEHAGLAVETSAKGRGGNRLRNLRRNFAHTVGTNDVFVRLFQDAARAGHPAPRWWSESQASRQFEYRNRRYWIRPDGAGCYYLDPSGKDRRYFLLEYDRATMRRRDYLRKLRGLAAYFKSGLAERQYGAGLTVLVVSETDQGERRFAEAIRSIEEEWSVDLPVLLTTRDRIRRHPGLLGPVWRTPVEEQRRNWIGSAGTPANEAPGDQ